MVTRQTIDAEKAERAQARAQNLPKEMRLLKQLGRPARGTPKPYRAPGRPAKSFGSAIGPVTAEMAEAMAEDDAFNDAILGLARETPEDVEIDVLNGSVEREPIRAPAADTNRDSYVDNGRKFAEFRFGMMLEKRLPWEIDSSRLEAREIERLLKRQPARVEVCVEFHRVRSETRVSGDRQYRGPQFTKHRRWGVSESAEQFLAKLVAGSRIRTELSELEAFETTFNWDFLIREEYRYSEEVFDDVLDEIAHEEFLSGSEKGVDVRLAA